MSEEEKIFGTNVNEIIELDSIDEEEKESSSTNDFGGKSNLKSSKKKRKNKLVEKWKNLPKKTKIILIILGSLVLVLIVALILFFAFKNEMPTQQVIVQEDNYRYENGYLILQDKDKNELGRYECQNKDENLCFVAYYTFETDLDKTKYVTEKDQTYLKRSIIYKNNFAFIQDGEEKTNSLKLYNIKTNTIDKEFDLIKEYDEENVIVKKDDKYGVINFLENALTKIELEYEFLGYYGYDENLIYAVKDEYGIMDISQKNLASKIKNPIKAYNDKYIVTASTSGYEVYDYSAKKIKIDDANYIELIEDYFIVINNGKLYIYDNTGSQLNKDGIDLDSSVYQKVVVVDDAGKVVEEKEAYQVIKDEDKITIKVKENETIINVLESKINNSLDYISYIDGKLYFYSDKEKTSLIGKYTCENKNNVSKEDKVFNNCFISEESKLIERKTNGDTGYLPIYNNRFVFIKDEQTGAATKNIVFYDLKLNKSLSNYVQVDTGFYSKSGYVNMAVSDDVMVIAKKADNVLIAFKIESSGVDTIIRNNYNAKEIKYLNEYLLAKYSDGTYHLFKLDGIEITKNISTTNEIVNYYTNYIVVKNADKYQIYNTETGKIISDEFNYLDLSNSYYVGIKDNKLNIYNYTSKNKLLCQDIQIEGMDYPNLYSLKYYNASYIELITSGKKYIFTGNMEYQEDGITKTCGLENEE